MFVNSSCTTGKLSVSLVINAVCDHIYSTTSHSGRRECSRRPTVTTAMTEQWNHTLFFKEHHTDLKASCLKWEARLFLCMNSSLLNISYGYKLTWNWFYFNLKNDMHYFIAFFHLRWWNSKMLWSVIVAHVITDWTRSVVRILRTYIHK